MIDKKVSLRNKHRFLRIAWMIVALAIIGVLVYFMYGTVELTMTLLTAFIVGVVLFIAYELVLLYELYQEKEKNNLLIRNSMFQIYFGKISLISAGFGFFMGFLFNLETTVVLFLFASVTLMLLVASFPYVREKVESKTPLKGG